MSQSNLYTIPNLLSYFRIAVIPVMILLFYFDSAFTAWVNVILFALAGISDFLDGYIARKTGQTTLLGKVLDLLADKLVVGVALVLLIAFDRLTGLWIIPVILIYMREIAVSSLREFMAFHGINVAVSKLGKWKLATQIVFINFLICGPYGEMLIPHAYTIGKIGFLAATVITLVSGWTYMREAWKTIQKLEAEGKT